MRRSQQVKLSLEDRAELERWFKDRTLPARRRFRAAVLLMADHGMDDTAIAGKLQITRQRCGRIRDRFLAEGIQALVKDRPKPGRPKQIDPERIISLTKDHRPSGLVLDWSRALMAREAGVSASSVGRIWNRERIKPQEAQIRVNKRHHFAERLVAILGLFLAPPWRALVLCVDEKKWIEPQSCLPLMGRLQGTSTLSAALKTLDETLFSTGPWGRDPQAFIRFLQQVDTQIPADQGLVLFINDPYKVAGPHLDAWMDTLPRFKVEYTTTFVMWFDAVLRLLRLLTKRPLRHGMARSMAELEAAIMNYLAAPEAGPKRFVWTAKLADLLANDAAG